MVAQKANFCPYCGAAQHGPSAAEFNQAPVTARPQPQVQPASTQQNQEMSHPSEEAARKISRQHLDPMAIVAFILSYIIKSGIILLLAAATIIIAPALSAIILGVYFTGIILIAILAYANFYYEVDEKNFEKQHGIFYKQTTSIPFEQIQNVNISRSLIEQLLGLASLEIETAGASGNEKKGVVGNFSTTAEGQLPGVSFSRARVLHDLLLKRAGELNK